MRVKGFKGYEVDREYPPTTKSSKNAVEGAYKALVKYLNSARHGELLRV